MQQNYIYIVAFTRLITAGIDDFFANLFCVLDYICALMVAA